MKRILAFLAAALALAAFPAEARICRSFTATLRYGGAQESNVPTPLRLSPALLPGFSYADTDGTDFEIADESGALLPYEIDTWNPAGESLLWVKVPVFATNKVLTVTYGRTNENLSARAAEVWSDYAGVWHLNETNATDSTANGFHGTAQGAVSPAASGRLGAAVSIDGTTKNSGISCGEVLPNPELLTNGCTVSAWVKPSAYNPTNHVSKQDGFAFFGKTGCLSFRFDSKTRFDVTTPGGADHKISDLALPATGQWFHVATTFVTNTSKGCKLYLGGSFAGDKSSRNENPPANPDGTTAMFLGRNQWELQGWRGDIDEIRLMTHIATPDYLAAEYAAMAQSDLLEYGELETLSRTAIDLQAIKPDGFDYGVVLEVDGYAAGRPALTNFPVLVRLSEAGIPGFRYGDVRATDGSDVRFADANGNALPFEIDTWTNGATSLIWVTLPEMTNGTEFAMFYGAAQSDANAFVAARHPWADYTGVWHMGDKGWRSGQTIRDSTTNQLSGETASNSSQPMADGAVGVARKICASTNSKNQEQISVSLSDPARKAVVDALVPQFSVSLWYRLKESVETSIQWDYLIGRKPSETNTGWAIQMSDPSTGGGVRYGFRLWSSETTDKAPPATAIPVIGKDNWTKVAWFKVDAVYDNINYSFYFNGALVESDVLKGIALNGSSDILGIGGAAPAASGVIRPFTGDMDEVRLRRGTVSADWVAADYATQTSPWFLSAGTVEKVGASTRPTAEFAVLDTGAAFVQFSGRVTSLGEGATACSLHYKRWKDSEPEPADWTPFATGVGAGAAVSHFVVGLETLTDYHVAFKASNDLATPEDSDIVSEDFTTSGVGDAGESGGASERQLDEFVHTFTVTERGVSSFAFTPPTGVTKVEALVVAGGGAGGYLHGGGGGGGGVVHNDALAVVPGRTYTINVGTGGLASASAGVYGGNGGDSSIALDGVALVSAVGGGAGGNGDVNTAGRAGGSGGGSSANVSGGAGTTGQGFAGAKGIGEQAGGGGGAKAPGSAPVEGGTGAVSSGGGGSGFSFEISGENIFYGGGGGGGGVKSVRSTTYGTAGTGGLGGGGDGGQETETADTAAAENGTDGLGGGGGGGGALAGYEKGGDGGSGVVIVRYGAGGDGTGVVNPTISLTGLAYDESSGDATVTYRVGWAGDGYDRADVIAIWGYDEDDLDHTNAVASSAIGQGTGSFPMPRVSRTVHVRLLARNSDDYTGVSPEVKSLVLFNPNAPVATISAPDVGCTNATFAVTVTDLGGASTSAAAELQLCADRFFDAGTYSTFPLEGSISAAGTLRGTVVGLETNRTYWARAVVTNDLEQDFTTDPIAVATIAPGAPEPAGVVGAIGFTTIGVDARLDGWGAGSYAATLFVEASTDPDFGTIAARSGPRSVSGTNVYERFELDGLLGGGTEYYLRVGSTNEWNIGAFADIPPVATRATPVASSGIAYFSEVADGTNTLSVIFGVTEVFDGVRSTATLYYGPSATSPPRVSSKPIAEPGTLRWEGLRASDKTMYAVVVVSAVAGGRICSERWSVRILPGTQTYHLADLDEFEAHASSANALIVKPGDAVVLPEPNGHQAYRVLNGRFAALAGTTLLALEPGICGVQFIEDDEVLSTLALLVLPEPIRGGGLFVLDEGAIPAAPADPYADWDSAATWRKIGNTTNDWPGGPNDTAVVPLYEHETAALIIRNADPVTVGAVYSGGYRDALADLTVAGRNNSNRRGFAFDRTDGRPALLQLCGNTTGLGADWNKRARFKFGNRISELRFLVDTRIDGGWSGGDPNANQGRVTFDSLTNRVEAGATVSLHEFDTQGQRQSFTVKLPNLAGSGTVWNRSAAMVRVSDDAGLFSGLLRDSGGYGAGNDSCTGPIFVQTATTTNCTGETVGWVGRKGADPTHDFSLGVGCFQTGWPAAEHQPDPHGPWFPKKGFSMHGGLLRLQAEWTPSWTGADPRGDVRDPDVLEIDGGFNYLYGSGTLRNYPTVWFEAGELRHPGTASLMIRDESVMGEWPATNQVTILHGVSDFAIGPAGDPASSWSYPIVPWIAQPLADSYVYIGFACFDENDRLVRTPFYFEAGAHDHVADRIPLADWDDDANVSCRFGSLRLAADKTVNSLYLQNEWVGEYNRLLGVGRTLTVSSGGLILAESKWTDGVTRFGAEDGGATNGTLRLGDQSHPAYVWAHGAERFSDDERHLEGPCQIWADVVAPGGLVSCYTGALLLGGNQTNIENEIVVNAGALVLGTTNTPCRLRPELPVRIHANAKLIVPNAESLTGTILQLDGAAGWFGTIEIEAGVEATCKKLYRRDYPEKPEWESLPRGVYTGDEATAVELGCFYEPGLFSGAGTLSVYRDDIIMPTIMILR